MEKIVGIECLNILDPMVKKHRKLQDQNFGGTPQTNTEIRWESDIMETLYEIQPLSKISPKFQRN